MKLLSASELLNVWERGLSQSPIQRAMTLLVAACTEMSPDQLANLRIGERDGLLLSLREQIFGSQLVSQAICPSCGDRLELTFSVSDIRIVPETEPKSVLVTTIDEYEVQYRLPNSLDLGAVTDRSDLARMRQQLLDRCLISAHFKDEDFEISKLSEDILSKVLAEMAQSDPQANIQLALSCPVCNHQWQEIFDVVSFFWIEIHAWARRLLGDVHILASTYGWREVDILAMSSQRRQLYLEMISG